MYLSSKLQYNDYVYPFQREQHGIGIWPVSLLLGTNSLKGRCPLVLKESNSQFILRMGYKWVSWLWRMQHSSHIKKTSCSSFYMYIVMGKCLLGVVIGGLLGAKSFSTLSFISFFCGNISKLSSIYTSQSITCHECKRYSLCIVF